MQKEEQLDFFLKIVFFGMPLFGVIYYFIVRNSSPKKADDALMSTIFGFGFGVLLSWLGVL